MAMKRVKIAELKDHLSQHLRTVEAGGEVLVTDRQRPIARILPVETARPEVTIISPRGDFMALRDRECPRVDLGVSSTSLLLEERGDR
jgi:prevent-host-death family protein